MWAGYAPCSTAVRLATHLERLAVALLLATTAGCQVDPHAGVWVGQGECYSCHQVDYIHARPPHVGIMPTTCGECHTEESWFPSTFQHNGFPRDGAHAEITCTACHGDPAVFEGIPTECAGCHMDDYEGAANPLHQGQLPTTCADCHATTAWQPAGFEHDTFPLLGSHAFARCASCHGDPPQYTGTPRECVGCHQDDYQAADNPLHAGNVPTTCSDCHGTTVWRPSNFEHSFPLEGAHASAGCAQCHGNPFQAEGLDRACVSCHEADYQGAQTPVHDPGFPASCGDCHGTFAWQPADFTHESFPIVGAHVWTDCVACHGDPPVYPGTPRECVGCHQDDYDATVNPPHGDNYPTTCVDCHEPTGWRPAQVTHDWFPLEGRHLDALCRSCHGEPPQYAGTPNQCVGCHRPDYNATENPPHPGNVPETCVDCHDVDGWRPSNFVHEYELVGAHTTALCSDCHGNPPVYVGTSSDCVSCHRADYDAAADPVHAPGYATTCADCHTPLAWRPADFSHDGFPLDGAHQWATCASCHGDPPTYAGTGSACVDCHRDEYDGVLDPRHAPNFPTTCRDCHSTTAFVPSSFDHSGFSLDGAHAGETCVSCHGDPPRYQGTPNTCVGCHRSDYDATRNPVHAPDFGTACADCHHTDAWRPAAFNHDRFPLHGAHALTACANCHGDPPTYAGTPSACVSCHRDDYDGSPYVAHPSFATTCADCHTDTAWTPATDGYHPDGTFRISSGRHHVACLDCHDLNLGSWTNGDNTNCIGCHEHSNDHHRDPAHPNSCLECHPRGTK